MDGLPYLAVGKIASRDRLGTFVEEKRPPRETGDRCNERSRPVRILESLEEVIVISLRKHDKITFSKTLILFLRNVELEELNIDKNVTSTIVLHQSLSVFHQKQNLFYNEIKTLVEL